MKRVLAVPGSVRRGSFNRLLLRAAAEIAPGDMTIELFDDLRVIPPFDEDREHDSGETMRVVRRLCDEVSRADGVLIATPEYNHSIPGVLKNAIDWLSRPGPDEVLIAKPIAVIGASSGRWGTRLAQGALRQVLYSTGSLVLPAPMMFVRDAEQLFDPLGHLVHAPTRRSLEAVLGAFATWIDLVSGQRITAASEPAAAS